MQQVKVMVTRAEVGQSGGRTGDKSGKTEEGT